MVVVFVLRQHVPVPRVRFVVEIVVAARLRALLAKWWWSSFVVCVSLVVACVIRILVLVGGVA